MDSKDTVDRVPDVTPSKPKPYLVPVIFEKESPEHKSATTKGLRAAVTVRITACHLKCCLHLVSLPGEECYGCIIGNENKPKLEAALVVRTYTCALNCNHIRTYVCTYFRICRVLGWPYSTHLMAGKFLSLCPMSARWCSSVRSLMDQSSTIFTQESSGTQSTNLSRC